MGLIDLSNVVGRWGARYLRRMKRYPAYDPPEYLDWAPDPEEDS